MTTTAAAPAPLGSIAPNPGAAQQMLSAYTERTDTGPLLGYIALYSVFGGEITLPDATDAFRQLGLRTDLLPGPLRADNAFERVTGSDGVRDTYDPDHLDTNPAGVAAALTTPTTGARSASLMIRPVLRDTKVIVRHIVREVCDETAAQLSYDSHLGEIRFHRDTHGARGHGQLAIQLDHTAIAALAPGERHRVHALATTVADKFAWQCRYLGSDRIRSMLLDYLRSLDAVPVRPTGGVYFVASEHTRTLTALSRFVALVGGGSLLATIPLPDADEMRALIVAAFVEKAAKDLKQLSVDIATARVGGANHAKTTALYDRFRAVQHQTHLYTQRLRDSLGDTHDALALVETQLKALLIST